MCYCPHFGATYYPERVSAQIVANLDVEISAPVARGVRGMIDKDRALGAYGQVLRAVKLLSKRSEILGHSENRVTWYELSLIPSCKTS
jgi:hypothetical protein